MAQTGAVDHFGEFGPAVAQSPVVLSVPHAGRHYPEEMLSAIRLPVAALRPLEDRHVDLVADAAHQAGGRREVLIVQHTARAWIDLNRSEAERDPKLDDGANTRARPFESHKLRSGLGLVPRRIGRDGDIWRRRLRSAEVDARIADCHRPYHAALRSALAAARARFGVAVLIDIHSMPPLGLGDESPRLVIGDRFGRSASGRIIACAEAAMEAGGWRYALNAPYAGGFILDQHGKPHAGVHALQLEFDRSLYLDDAFDAPGPGLTATAALLRTIIDAIADEVLAQPGAIAAE